MQQPPQELVRRARIVGGRAKRRVKGIVRPERKLTSIEPWAIPPERAPELLERADSDLERLFYGHRGRPLHKWTHYIERYEQHLGRYRGTSFGMLEIGVFEGGSLELWRNYFGPDARIMGIDINPDCADRVDSPNLVRIGSQDDPEFLRECVAELGALDVVLDDGSHVGRHQWASFRALFPLLADGGLYVIEDLHTSYWPSFEGGAAIPTSGIGLVRSLIDDMHGWYFDGDDETSAMEWVTAIHVYDSMVFIEKNRRNSPQHILVGDDS